MISSKCYTIRYTGVIRLLSRCSVRYLAAYQNACISIYTKFIARAVGGPSSGLVITSQLPSACLPAGPYATCVYWPCRANARKLSCALHRSGRPDKSRLFGAQTTYTYMRYPDTRVTTERGHRGCSCGAFQAFLLAVYTDPQAQLRAIHEANEICSSRITKDAWPTHI